MTRGKGKRDPRPQPFDHRLREAVQSRDKMVLIEAEAAQLLRGDRVGSAVYQRMMELLREAREVGREAGLAEFVMTPQEEAQDGQP